MPRGTYLGHERGHKPPSQQPHLTYPTHKPPRAIGAHRHCSLRYPCTSAVIQLTTYGIPLNHPRGITGSMGNLVERSSQPELISGSHLALLENLDPLSKFVAAHSQYQIRQKRRRDQNLKKSTKANIERTRSTEWSKERQQEYRTGDYTDTTARLLEPSSPPTMGHTLHLENQYQQLLSTTTTATSSTTPLSLNNTDIEIERISLNDICLAVTRLKASDHLGRVGAYSIRRNDFISLFVPEEERYTNATKTTEERIRNIWSIWCEAAAEEDAQQARVDALQLLAGLIWLVPGAIGQDRLRASVELFDPRFIYDEKTSNRQSDDGPRNKKYSSDATTDVSLSKHEVSSMLMTTLSGLCVWTDGFFLPPQASQITQISHAIFQENNLEFHNINGRINLKSLLKCAVAMEQVSLERLLCAEGLSKEMDDNVRSSATRRSWMESFYYASYDEKRMRMMMDESTDQDGKVVTKMTKKKIY